MQVLLDTNLVIGREDPRSPPPGLSELIRLFSERAVRVLIHPVTVAELDRDSNLSRREVVQAKARSYPVLSSPPIPTDAFVAEAGGSSGSHDDNDLAILFAVKCDAVNFLLTEDRGLIHRAFRSGLDARVLSLSAAGEYFRALFSEVTPQAQRILRQAPVHSLIAFLERRDPFFESILRDYPRFEKWVREIAREGRHCIWMPAPDGSLGAVLIYKDETEPLLDRPPARRLKLCTFKVSEKLARQRVSELLLSWALAYGHQNGYTESYVTVFPEHKLLVDLLGTFGFQDIGGISRDERVERVLLKRLRRLESDPLPPAPEYYRLYFPDVRTDASVPKYLVPIEPTWHARLFPEYRSDSAQTMLDDFGEVDRNVSDPGGNAIRKAYLCHSPNRSVAPGSLLFFYRSHDVRRVTHLGVTEEVRICPSVDDVLAFVGNRTVIPLSELNGMCATPVLAILFWAVGPASRIHPSGLAIDENAAWPQSITSLSEEAYLRLCG